MIMFIISMPVNIHKPHWKLSQTCWEISKEVIYDAIYFSLCATFTSSTGLRKESEGEDDDLDNQNSPLW
jgi:hypothetical protein